MLTCGILGAYFHRKKEECAESIGKMTQVIKVADPRVVVEQGVVLNDYEGPLQWEHYKIPASGLSDTQITFANLVTLGTNRIYNSGFEVEYNLEVTYPATVTSAEINEFLHLKPFPLSQVSDQIRCNINGAACVSRPATTMLQRMPYWRQKILDKTCSFVPHELPPAGKPGITGATAYGTVAKDAWKTETINTTTSPVVADLPNADKQISVYVPMSPYLGDTGDTEYEKKITMFEKNVIAINHDTGNRKITFTIREPIMCPPFNSRLDNLYQRPLCNITSLDIVYTLNDLRLMLTWNYWQYNKLKISQIPHEELGIAHTADINAHISSAQLCFDVASLPAGMTVPPSITMPYYDYVNYVTDIPGGGHGSENLEVTSGVYTLSQVPTAIYIFVSENINFRTTYKNTEKESHSMFPDFAPINHIELTVGNNTKILDTTTMLDRYKMCLANGLEGVTWHNFSNPQFQTGFRWEKSRHVLRLIPGIDFTIPEQRLVGGSPADQLVFQARVTTNTTGCWSTDPLSLWIMFEYCGVLTIEPVHASIDMIPLKTIPERGPPQVVASVAATDIHGGGEGTEPRGAGIFDIVNTGVGLAKRGLNWLGRKGVFGWLNKRYGGDDMSDAPPAKIGAGLMSGQQFYD